MPNYQNLGLSTPMGPQLRALVEHQLLDDLAAYGLDSTDLKFDWSESCIEGHDADYLDGSLENYSGIAIYNSNDQLIAEGGMEFIHLGPFFLCYWEFLDTWTRQRHLVAKGKIGIPDHVWTKIPDDFKNQLRKDRMVTSPFK